MNLLIAEDEHDLSRAVKVLLEHEHYVVDTVDNGDDALAYAETGRYDGLILDVMMPGLDGFEVLRRLRAQGIDTPALFLTAKSQIEDRVEGLDLGADDYIVKPFAFKELAARVRAMLRRPQEISDQRLTLGDLTLDRATGYLEGPLTMQELTAKEFQLLEYLMLNPGRTLSADQMMEKVWGFDADAQINVVWVNLSNLRRALTEVGSSAQIITQRGLGYRFEASHA